LLYVNLLYVNLSLIIPVIGFHYQLHQDVIMREEAELDKTRLHPLSIGCPASLSS